MPKGRQVDEKMKFSGFMLMAVFVPDPVKRSAQRKCHRNRLFQSSSTIK